MRPVGDAFLRTLTGSHAMAAEVKLCTPGSFQTGVNPTGTTLDLIDGDVRLDGNADVRSTLNCEITGEGWIPEPGQPITPYGNELFARRAIEFGDGTREWVSLGYFKMYGVDQDGTPDAPLQIVAYDRMKGIQEYQLLRPVAFDALDTFADAFGGLVNAVYPSVTIEYDFNAALDLLDRKHVAEEDRYQFLLDLCKSRGKVMYFDYRGVLVVKSPPDPTVPVFEVGSGENGVLISLRRGISREGVFNGVLATGDAPDTNAPVRVAAYDMAPTSPTYWEGPFGKVPKLFSSPFISNATNGAAAATAELLKVVGLPYAIDFQMVPNPALEPLDPIVIKTDAGAETHILDSLTVPLSANVAATGATRQLTVHNIEVQIG